MAKVGIIGASGFAGAELLRLCADHPALDVAMATGDTQAGERLADVYPSLSSAYGDVRYQRFEPGLLDGLDLVFLGLPHGASQALVPELIDQVDHIVDLAADFRLADPALYPTWYGADHTAPELLDRFAYGLPELFRSRIVGADHVAVPGCFPTTASLVLAPLMAAGMIEPTGIVVDAASGVSGAGRAPKATTTFCAVDEDFTAYGLLTHRHTPEIEQVLTAVGQGPSPAQVLFTPHLAPMNRGILATCYARPVDPTTSTDDVRSVLAAAYAEEPFVVVTDGPPSTKATAGSNAAHLHASVDPRTGWVVGLGALDNLVKGASGQAVQCANLLLGLPETTGLSAVGVYP